MADMRGEYVRSEVVGRRRMCGIDVVVGREEGTASGRQCATTVLVCGF